MYNMREENIIFILLIWFISLWFINKVRGLLRKWKRFIVFDVVCVSLVLVIYEE